MIKKNHLFNTLLVIILVSFNTLCQAKTNLNLANTGNINQVVHVSHGKRTIHIENLKETNINNKLDSKSTQSPSKIKQIEANTVKQKHHLPRKAAHLVAHAKNATPEKVIESTDVLGIATYYGDDFQGKRTASGEIYDMHKLTTVHNNYPFGTVLRVTNLQNNRSVTVRVNDRGRLSNNSNHLLDVSKQAALELGFLHAGKAKVKIETISGNT